MISIRIAALVTALALGATACGPSTAHSVVDMVMTSAYRPRPQVFARSLAASPEAGGAAAAPVYELLAGDLHCHVLPPDSPQEVNRTLDETIDLAARERLDFV